MIYYYITIALLIGMFIYQYICLNRLFYTQTALESFRELRHKATINLSEKVRDGYSFEELQEHRDFLQKVNDIIRHFDLVKKVTNFKSVRWIYSNIIFSTQKLKETDNEKSESLYPYKIALGKSVMTLFEAIPFLKLRVVFYLCRVVVSFLMALGIKSLKNSMTRMEKLQRAHDDISNHNGCLV